MNDDISDSARLGRAGAISGCFWFFIALLFDKGVQDFNYPVMPTDSIIAITGCLLAAAITGASIALFFGRLLLKRSKLTFFLLPLATIPMATSIFSVLVWIVWLLVGETEGGPRLHHLATILSFFVLYACISLLAIFVYLFAILNQLAIRAYFQSTEQRDEPFV